jgi:patatin-related protein
VREKELRIALVCFGGISLAIYMHGISKEILKLVRASCVLHDIADRNVRLHASFFDRASAEDPEFDTEAIYFELLRDIGRKLELRVIVDIIAGASAGGINAVMLARALSHDLPMGALRDLWLDNGDVSVLLAPEARARAWSKWILMPFLWIAAKTGLIPIREPEVLSKLSVFVRSRWFKPPLGGNRMSELMYDAILAMGAPKQASASLVPANQRLDLFVTLTDFHGYHQSVQIHDPAIVHEREHRHVLRFGYRRSVTGEVESDFRLENAPGLAFAARATSSFPGAFPPARIVELDELVARRNMSWPTRTDFIARNFAGQLHADVDPVSASFIDGSVLNNRPFREAIAAIQGRPAYRPVDRRLVYIDPDPDVSREAVERVVPGFFSTLKRAMSDIPRNQPVIDELSWVLAFNDQARRLKAVIDGARPHISGLVARILSTPAEEPLTAEQIRTWREQANRQVALDAGFAYQGYVRLKLASVRAFISGLIVKLRNDPWQSPLTRVIAEIVDAWACHAGGGHAELGGETLTDDRTAVKLPRWAEFLLGFDIEYRKRRLNFMIEGLNRIYGMLDQPGFEALDPAAINRLKRSFYGVLERLRIHEDSAFFGAKTRDFVARMFPAPPSAVEAKDLAQYAQEFVKYHGDDFSRLMEHFAAEIDLEASTRELDQILSKLDSAEWPSAARREVLVNYLGFPFWDVLTFSVATSRNAGEFNEILIDRISPRDSRTLEGFGGPQSLKGLAFGHFAAFLSRAYRENDYLIGRLHAIDRLIDIICDSVELDAALASIDIVDFKKRAFLKVLEAEEKHLRESTELIAALRESVARIGSSEGRMP